MDNRYNFYNLEASFRQWLLAGIEKTPINANAEKYQRESTRKSLTKISVKNYLSDLRHFLGWLIFKLKVKNQKLKIEEGITSKFISYITPETIEEYKSYLLENNIPLKTTNRRLSTVRKFCSFCISQGWMRENPAKKIKNEKIKNKNDNEKLDKEQILKSFQQDLQKENFDQKTITSYLEAVREFLQV